MKLTDINSNKHPPYSMNRRKAHNVGEEVFSENVIKQSLAIVKKSSIYKKIIKLGAKEDSTDRQLKKGSISFECSGTNGYYVTVSGFVRVYGIVPDHQWKNRPNVSKYEGQTRLSTKEKIIPIDTDQSDENVISLLTSRYIMLLETLYDLLIKKVKTNA